MVFCIQNSDFSTRITSLYGSQTSPVVLCMQNSVISTRINSLHGSHTSPVVLCIQNNVISIKKLVSMDPSPHLWLLHAKQRLLDQNYKSLWVPALMCGFCMQNSNFRTRITSRYGPQTLPMVFCIQNSDFSTRITSLYGSQPSFVVLHGKQRLLDQNYKSLRVPGFACYFVHSKQRD